MKCQCCGADKAGDTCEACDHLNPTEKQKMRLMNKMNTWLTILVEDVMARRKAEAKAKQLRRYQSEV